MLIGFLGVAGLLGLVAVLTAIVLAVRRAKDITLEDLRREIEGSGLRIKSRVDLHYEIEEE